MPPMTEIHTTATRTETVHKPAPKRAMSVANILAIIGFIILLVIVIWGLIHLARLSSPWFASLFDSDNSAIVVTAPADATNGKAVQINWKHEAEVEGMYAFMYQCTQGVQFKVTAPDETLLTIPCGAAFSAGPLAKTITVLPTLSGTTTATANISIVFIPREQNPDEHARGNAAIKITNGSTVEPEPTTPTTPRPTTPTNPRPTNPPAQTGPANLRVVITSISTDASGMTTATFDIANVGGSTSGTYYFNATLPTSPMQTYASQPQNPLGVGSHIVNTLRFAPTTSGTFSVTVTGDSSPANNSASQFVNAPTQYYSAPYQQQYPTYQTPYYGY